MDNYTLNDKLGMDKRSAKMYDRFQHKVSTFPPGVCPVTVTLSNLMASRAQGCHKCTPCHLGLEKIEEALRTILSGEGTEETLKTLRSAAELARDCSDCAIGYMAGLEVCESLDAFADDYESHIKYGQCVRGLSQTIPCVTHCPAHVDIPGYIAHVGNEDYASAIALIRRDNPFPVACAMICEHPCENRCRRGLIDAPLNIRGMKKYAVDQIASDKVFVPEPQPSTGKKVAVIGGGPAGLTCAYFLSLMGHKVTVYEGKERLGGMLMYGIPNYRFPKDRMDEDIRAILSTGNIEVKLGVNVGKDIPIQEVKDAHDAMFVAIGAQVGKKLRLEGVDAGNVFSAVEMLDQIGHDQKPDYTGKAVCVIGGGNVAMDAARSALRCGASEVHIVYRRRQADMTALETEIESAVAEGIDLMVLQAPKAIEKDADGNCSGLWVQPQMVGPYDRGGRPGPVNANKPAELVPCEVVLIAVGQDIVSAPFEEFGMEANWNVFKAGNDTAAANMPGVFVGGDCATGPATAIRAIAAGKVAAYNIDKYLGCKHVLDCGVTAPVVKPVNFTPTGRVAIVERPAKERRTDFEGVEVELTYEEAQQECGRCLRCDHYGHGACEMQAANYAKYER